MKTCICTVIKDEQEYLDEWIKYHLDLGVDRIFIFEDIDSKTHMEICDRYSNVNLFNVFDVLSETSRQEAILVKTSKNFNVLHIYYRNILTYIQDKYKEYEWCFAIDPDEFITLGEKYNSISDVLSDYIDYNAIVLSWKCYGANGLIGKPDYSKCGVIGTYTKEANIPNEVKTCYKLNTFKTDFLYTHHHPTDKCKWCNTEYSKDINKPIFSKIYLRHYITKSWEEYVWKYKTRGYTWGNTCGGSRSFDFFFKVNPDLLDKKDELIKKSASCICTVIKNEHEYLDEWIKYHLDLGVDHIFIFEDIDSETHDYITNKYENVSLFKATDILNEKDKQEAVNLKKTKRYNIQHLYFRNILRYIKERYGLTYDWCFVIDADEFITVEKNKKLWYALYPYNDYDAVIMKWECYGANGLINKPDYSKSGIMSTYTKKMTGKLPDKTESLVKTCYNLHTYNSRFFFNEHHPTKLCNWVNTNFAKTYCDNSFKNIYIKHYITKSFEEYVWKKNIRGFTWDGTRGINTFFMANPELICMETELMETLKDEILVILPYKQSKAQGTELEIALSLWKKHCTFKYHFVVIGEYDKKFEEKFPWVEFIECKSKEKIVGQYNPHLDILNKFMTVMDKYQDRYTGFVAICDDEYAIKPFTLFDILQTHYHSYSFTGIQSSPTSYWNHDKWKTRQLFDKEGLPHVNYTTHFPYWYDMNKLKFIVEKFNLKNESYVLEDVYFNYYKHDTPILDSEIRLGIWNNEIFEKDFNNALNNSSIKFMCNSVEGWSEKLENKLKNILSY